MTTLESDLYLIAKYNRNGGYNRQLSFRVTKSLPALDADEVPIKISLKLPVSLFNRPRLVASLEIPEDQVTPPSLDVDVLEGLKMEMQRTLGVSMDIHLVEPDTGADQA